MVSKIWFTAFLLLKTVIDFSEAQEAPEAEGPEMEGPENGTSAFFNLPGCGVRPFIIRGRVIGGVNATANSWPWIISLRIAGLHNCGGSLIRPNWVLTATHCLFDPILSKYTVVVGAHSLSGSTPVQEVFTVKRIIRHPDFSWITAQNDIGLLELNGNVTLSRKVNPACLPPQGSRISPGTPCVITGWGQTIPFGPRADILQQATLPVGNQSDCSRRNGAIVPIDERSMLCAGGQGTSGACRGDSGGPLNCLEGNSWVVRGVSSWGGIGCPTDLYSVFARVSSYIDWISQNVSG